MNAYIVHGLRSPVAKAHKGGFRNLRPDDLAATVIKAILEQLPELNPSDVDDLIVGNAVPEAEQGMQMGRIISLLALPEVVPGMLVNRYCGSGLEAIAIAAARIHAGQADCIIAGGTESMSLVPVMGWKTALNYKISSQWPHYYSSMGITAENVANKYEITREAQDQFAFESHKKAIAAIESGAFSPEIVPIAVNNQKVENRKIMLENWTVAIDEGPRKDTSVAALANLKPVFAQNGTVTAGNSSQTSDGAAFVVLMSEKRMNALGLSPKARMASYATAGVDPSVMGIGPIAAVPKALHLAGIQLSDIDLIELNEAFAAQSLAVMRMLDFNPAIVNVNGGAIALGHPLGCSGAKLSLQLINEMQKRKNKYGLVTACVGGGQGVAGIFEVF